VLILAINGGEGLGFYEAVDNKNESLKNTLNK